jgi:hypothetical protein
MFAIEGWATPNHRQNVVEKKLTKVIAKLGKLVEF